MVKKKMSYDVLHKNYIMKSELKVDFGHANLF